MTSNQRVRAEIGGWITALSITLIVVAQVSVTARAELLFRDADSVVVALFVRSLAEGTAENWAMSSVLFIPEIAVFAGLWALLHGVFALDVTAVLAVGAVVHALALYGALRFAAGRYQRGRSPVLVALCGFAVFGVLVVTETSASRDSLELVSLSLTGTYYVATVVAMLLTVGAVRRRRETRQHARALVAWIGIIAAVSVLSNPLFVAWVTSPLVLLLGFWMLRGERSARIETAALIGGSAVGFLLRIPFSEFIANTGVGYAQPSQWLESVGYYGALWVERLSSPGGVFAAIIVIALLGYAIVQTWRAGDAGRCLVAASAWVIPLVVLLGMTALGTHAARYLQPVAVAPLLAVLTLRLPATRVTRVAALIAGVAVLIGGALSVPRLVSTVTAKDTDLACVVDWVNNADGQVGAGQFWSVRLPKLHLDNPAQLVQVDHELNGYAWLVDRTDFDAIEVTFLVEDAMTVPWALERFGIYSLSRIECGRYSVIELPTPLRLGPQRS